MGDLGSAQGQGGKLDHNKALTGDDFRDFVNLKLFPYLHGFEQKASGPNTIEYKIGEIFGEIKNKIQSGYNLARLLTGSMSCVFDHRPKSMSYPTFTKPRSKTWAMPDVTVGVLSKSHRLL